MCSLFCLSNVHIYIYTNTLLVPLCFGFPMKNIVPFICTVVHSAHTYPYITSHCIVLAFLHLPFAIGIPSHNLFSKFMWIFSIEDIVFTLLKRLKRLESSCVHNSCSDTKQTVHTSNRILKYAVIVMGPPISPLSSFQVGGILCI